MNAVRYADSVQRVAGERQSREMIHARGYSLHEQSMPDVVLWHRSVAAVDVRDIPGLYARCRAASTN